MKKVTFMCGVRCSYTVKNNFWETNAHLLWCGFTSLIVRIFFHPRNPVIAGFISGWDRIIFYFFYRVLPLWKAQKNYIVGEFLNNLSLSRFFSGSIRMAFRPDRNPAVSALSGVIRLELDLNQGVFLQCSLWLNSDNLKSNKSNLW